MKNIIFARKLETFSELAGQVKTGIFFHAHLIVCEDEWSSENIARSLAIELVSDSTCAEDKVLAGSHPDVKILGGKQFLVKDADDVCEDVTLYPLLSRSKVFILLNFDNATMQAQNKLLKTFEEPQKNNYFIMTCKNEDKVLRTIRSRCKVTHVKRTSEASAKNILLERFSSEKFNGYLGSCLSESDGEILIKASQLANKIAFEVKNSGEIALLTKELLNKDVARQALKKLSEIYEKTLIYIVNQNQVSGEQSERIANLARELSVGAIRNILSKIDSSEKAIMQNAGSVVTFDVLMLTILEEKYLCKKK